MPHVLFSGAGLAVGLEVVTGTGALVGLAVGLEVVTGTGALVGLAVLFPASHVSEPMVNLVI
jgi:hypothetical protein